MVLKKCIICKTDFRTKKSHLEKGWGKYCSKECQFKGQLKGKEVFCKQCGKKIYRRPSDYKKSKSKNFFCSRACHCAWENENVRCGVNAPNWLVGKSSYRMILKRSGSKEECSKCGLKDKRVLVVHHKDKNKKNNHIDNLEWLCCNCHCLVHLV